MNVTIRYTQPKISATHVPKIKDHVVECSDVDTSPNGVPIPIAAEPHVRWRTTFANIEQMPSHEIL